MILVLGRSDRIRQMTAKSHNEIPQALSKRKIMLVGGTLALLVGLGLAYGISGYETNP